MAVAPHPSPGTLAAFARGDLPPAERSSVAQHVSGCSDCCARLFSGLDETHAPFPQQETGHSDNKVPGVRGRTSEATPTVATVSGSERKFTSTQLPQPLLNHPRYQILRKLGAGGMGVVYIAEHRIMGRLVALKVMAPHLTAKVGAAESFRKEVRAAAQLNHPNIVTAYDADEAGGLHFLVMEYVEGTSLDRLVARKGPVTVPLACSFICQAALGLHTAHQKGMVHRDIKPQNMMVTRKAQVKVMDFGLARFVHTDEEASTTPGRLPFGAGRPVADPLTNPNLLMGTPDYLSPEQAKNSHNVDSRSDIYSLGCTLFFLLTGKPPFAHAVSLIDKLLAHTEEVPPSIRELRLDVPEGLVSVLKQMLAKKPDERYDTAAEVAAAIHPFTRGGEDVEAQPDELDGIVGPIAERGHLRSEAELVSVASGYESAVSDTKPVARERTVVEPDRPRKSSRSKRSRSRSWWDQNSKLVLKVMAVSLFLAIAFVVKKKNTPSSSDTAETRPLPLAGPGQAGATAEVPVKQRKLLPFLYVVPSQGVNGRDYYSVKSRLQEGGVRVVTTSGQGGTASPSRFDLNETAVSVDVKITDVDPQEYSGVTFCGFDIEEYIDIRPGTPVTRATKSILDKMLFLKRPIGSICIGEGVLAVHGVLKDKPAATSPLLMKWFPRINSGGRLQDQGVVVAEGKIITASGAQDSREFADALIEALRSK